ncbi:MAG: TetR/AcrR family transcriptional regulator [Clostridiaceae bacterium]
MRKRDETLREQLLAAAREIVSVSGAEALNIRDLAARAGIATGTIYNYFENKDEVLLTLSEEYWKNALSDLKAQLKPGRFSDQLKYICAFLREHVRDTRGNLMKSLGGARSDGILRMRGMQSMVVGELVARLNADEEIRADLWTDDFTRERFARFVFENLLASISSEGCEHSFLVMIVGRVLYGD